MICAEFMKAAVDQNDQLLFKALLVALNILTVLGQYVVLATYRATCALIAMCIARTTSVCSLCFTTRVTYSPVGRDGLRRARCSILYIIIM